MEINLENMIIIKKEWFRSTCPTLRVTTKRIRLNKIGLSALNKPKDISVCADLENKKIIVSAADVAEDHTAFLEDLFHSMNWNPEYQYRLLGEKHKDQLHFQLESVMVKQEKD